MSDRYFIQDDCVIDLDEVAAVIIRANTNLGIRYDVVFKRGVQVSVYGEGLRNHMIEYLKLNQRGDK